MSGVGSVVGEWVQAILIAGISRVNYLFIILLLRILLDQRLQHSSLVRVWGQLFAVMFECAEVPIDFPNVDW